MKGVIFNLLEEVVCQHHGEAAWDEVLDHARVSGVYTTLGNYPHAELEELVESAGVVLGMPGDVLRWYGRAAMPLLFRRCPGFFDAHACTLDFVRALNTIIHPEVMKLYPGSRCPMFDARTAANGALLLGYDSERRFCMLAHGFIEGAADHYGETATVEHLACMHDGDPSCLLRIVTT